MKFYQSFIGYNCTEGKNIPFPATVPGNIQKDYAIANNFKDWHFADNYKQFLPLENDHWEYKTNLEYEKHNGERVYFVSLGINYKYDIILNDEIIYSYEGMFRGFEIDITDKLVGNDELKVHIYPHPKSGRGMADMRDEANESCNPPVYYGWDWNPRLLISGIWDDTYIETRGADYISGCEVLYDIRDDLSIARVKCRYNCATPCTISLYDAEGNTVYCGEACEFTVNDPKLWWCNGQGEPYLYTWEIKNGTESQRGKIGFRRLRLVQNAGCDGPYTFPKGRYEAPITIELNNRRIFAKGSNWVNPELFWGEITADRYRELITLAKECNMNIFRMWGGAGTPKESFYDICDELGMMIWQEFPLACNNYIDELNYMKVLESEASAIITKFRHHPALAFWCGGNELFNSWSGMDEQSHPLRLLNKLCYDLDYKRPFLFTSPLYGMAHGGYTFYAPDQGGDSLQQFQKSYNTAYTEFGVPALAGADILRKIIPEDELFPPRVTEAWVAHHGYFAWGKERWVCRDVLDRYFTSFDSIDDMCQKSSWLQCEGYHGVFEEMRRQWPHCSMAVNWCFNEPWETAGGNDLIAYPNIVRPCYAYVKAALRPCLFSAKIAKFDWREGDVFEAELWLLNDSTEKISGDVHVTATVGDTVIDLGSWHGETEANANRRGPTVRFIIPEGTGTDRVVLNLAAKGGLESKYELLCREKLIVDYGRQLNV